MRLNWNTTEEWWGHKSHATYEGYSLSVMEMDCSVQWYVRQDQELIARGTAIDLAAAQKAAKHRLIRIKVGSFFSAKGKRYAVGAR
jgi:hypothetical protein